MRARSERRRRNCAYLDAWLPSRPMDSVQQNLRAYYEEEARLRLRKPVTGRRVELRDEFLTPLRAERRRSVVDFGAGPGRDGEAFVTAGLDFVGLDLAHANGVLAAERGITVVQGPVDAPPCRAEFFDAGWSISTLMVEHASTWNLGVDEWQYQVFQLRVGR